ncbi:hypothetical protein [Methanococcoides sp. AM1]|uniref:hypothetical protein n=1 Tax=Methanococcoides sp. AM1 TaxID=1201011 RepID=UPI0010823509|nr:hypothetical protein [Methanococcoides sp. AM1]
MSLSTGHKVTLFVAILGAAVTVGVALYTLSPEMIHDEIQPPEYIPTYSSSDFHFKVSNDGGKPGSYYLMFNCKDESISFMKRSNEDYENELGFGYALPKDDTDSWHISVKANKSYTPENTSFTFTYVDACGIIHDVESYTFYYDFDDGFNRYVYKEMKFDSKRTISFN